MAARVLMNNSESMAEAAIRVGCMLFAGYVITPSENTFEYFAQRMPELGRQVVIPESELAVINIIYGAAAGGARAMCASSSTAISLMQENMASIASAEFPCVVVNFSRGSLQGDYFQATRGGGHGDYRFIVFGPENGQELVDCTVLAFDLADQWRNPALILGDYVLANATESVVLPEWRHQLPPKPWAATGAKGRPPNFVGFEMGPNWHNRRQKYAEIATQETRYESRYLEDAELVVVAFGTAARFAKPAIKRARQEGLKVGLLRPITLWPYPYQAIAQAAQHCRAFLVIELNDGQMLEDVRLGVEGKKPVHFWGFADPGEWFRHQNPNAFTFYAPFGPVFSSEEAFQEIKKVALSLR